MEIVFYIFAKIVSIFLSAVSLAMLVRVILSWFVNVEDNKIYILCCYISEPFILPFRILFSKLGIGEGLPIDLPFFVSYLVLSIISMFLPVI